jgi:hypothetical protein
MSMTVTIVAIVTGPRKSCPSMVTNIATLVTIVSMRTTNRHQEKPLTHAPFGLGGDGDARPHELDRELAALKFSFKTEVSWFV